MFRNLVIRFKNKTRGDWAVLLLSLLLAFSVWFVYTLSGEYSAFLEYDIVAQSEIEGHSNISSAPAKLIIRGKASGFNIIHRRLLSSVPIIVDVPPSIFKQSDGSDEQFYLTEDALREIMPNIGVESVQLEYFVTSRLEFHFSKEEFKKVPVLPNAVIGCKSQYMVIGDVVSDPDSVSVYGPSQILRNIDYINTESIYLEDLDANHEGVVSLITPNDVRLSEDMIHYMVNVSRYVEMKTTVALTVENLPAGKRVVMLPSKVEVIYRVPFPFYKDRRVDFVMGIDYNDFHKINGTAFPVRALSVPDGVISYRVLPGVVEVLERE